MRPFFRKIPLHGLLFPTFTVLALAANNLGQIQINAIFLPLLISTLFSFPILLLVWLISKDLHQAGIGALIFGVFTLTYGHFYNLMESRVIGNWVIGTHLYVLIIWVVVFLLLTMLVFKKVVLSPNLTATLNIVMIAVTLLQIGRITTHQVQAQIMDLIHGDNQTNPLLKPSDPDSMPDVYFIILDKYARSDALKSYYDYDNSEFITTLEEMGFWVADCSRSNYAFTVMSLSSQLNMAYVEDLTNEPSLETTSALIRNNRVHQAFEDIGYTTIAFDMGFPWGNFKGSDYYYDDTQQNLHEWSINPFELLYLRSTMGVLLFTKDVNLARQMSLSDLEQKAQRTKLILEALPEIPTIPGPKFIHAHIITPHPPYIFNADGTLNLAADQTDPREGYLNQLEFIEPRILNSLEQIIDHAENPPVIILQGDHGFGNRYANANLLALYLPGEEPSDLDERMTLVNVFPCIFNTYFGADMDYLPNRSYFHTDDWYQSILAEDWNPACKGE